MNPEEYLEWRNRFESVWHKQPQLIALLRAEDQWQLHDYFQFHDHKTEPFALGWFYTIRQCDPSVEDNALVAFEKLQRKITGIEEMKDQLALPFAGVKNNPQRIKIYPLVNPEPEIDEFVGALIDLAQQLAQQQRINDERRELENR